MRLITLTLKTEGLVVEISPSEMGQPFQTLICNPIAGINISKARLCKTTDPFELDVSLCCSFRFV